MDDKDIWKVQVLKMAQQCSTVSTGTLTNLLLVTALKLYNDVFGFKDGEDSTSFGNGKNDSSGVGSLLCSDLQVLIQLEVIFQNGALERHFLLLSKVAHLSSSYTIQLGHFFEYHYCRPRCHWFPLGM